MPERVALLLDLLLGLGVDHADNVRRLLSFAGESLGGVYAVAYRAAGDRLVRSGAWNAPPTEFSTLRRTEERLARAALSATPRAPLLAPGPFTAGGAAPAGGPGYCAGLPLPVDGSPAGVLLVFLREAAPPPAADLDLLARLARALGREEERRRQNDALVDLDLATRHIAASLREGLILYGPDLRYALWNPFMERLTGTPAAEVIGRRPEEVFPFLVEAGVLQGLKRALAGEHPPPIEFSITPPGAGRTIRVSDMVSPLRDLSGGIVGVIGTVRDVTDLAAAEAEARAGEMKFRAILEASMDGFLLIDGTGRVADANAAYARMSGFAREELLRLAVPDLEADESPEEARRHLEEILAGGRDRFETRHRRKDGRLIPVEVRAAAVDVEGGRHLAVFVKELAPPGGRSGTADPGEGFVG